MSLKLTLRELEVFVAVARYGTVTRAAEHVSMTQSAASQTLVVLQNALNTVLFDRVGRNLVLNEHGRLLLPKARAVLDAANELQSVFESGATHLRLGASTTIAHYLLPECIAAFRRAHPQAHVALMVSNTNGVAEAVATFRVDMGLIEGPCHHPDLLVRPWQKDELVMFVSAKQEALKGVQRLDISSVAGLPWILREQGSGTREVVEQRLLPILGHVTIAMELGDSEAIKRTVMAGFGVSCLPRCIVTEQLTSGVLREIETGQAVLTRQLSLVTHKNKVWTKGMSAFFDLIFTSLNTEIKL